MTARGAKQPPVIKMLDLAVREGAGPARSAIKLVFSLMPSALRLIIT
jgi:hypothetical protein